jgi:hypothetical protein
MTTTGIVQKVTIIPGPAIACAWIGPTADNSEIFFVLRDGSESAAEGAFDNSMVDALVAAAVGQRQVVAFHGDQDARITSLRVDPA